MLKTNEIYCMDCLEGLKLLPNNFVDLIITSPPYNLGNNHHTGSKRHRAYNDDLPEEEYQKWQIEVLIECHRVLKKDGSMLYNHKNRIKKGIQITPYEWILKTKFIVKQEIIWVNRSQNFDNIRFYPFTERIYWLAKDKDTKLLNVLRHPDIFNWLEWKPVGTNGSHTRAFPLRMIKDLLKVFPNAKLVLDPFIGSGTVALACKQSGRDFIGFEINPDYVESAKKNLELNQEKKYSTLKGFY